MHKEKDANIWKPPEIDHKEVEECKKFKAPAHQVDTKILSLRIYVHTGAEAHFCPKIRFCSPLDNSNI